MNRIAEATRPMREIEDKARHAMGGVAGDVNRLNAMVHRIMAPVEATANLSRVAAGIGLGSTATEALKGHSAAFAVLEHHRRVIDAISIKVPLVAAMGWSDGVPPWVQGAIQQPKMVAAAAEGPVGRIAGVAIPTLPMPIMPSAAELAARGVTPSVLRSINRASGGSGLAAVSQMLEELLRPISQAHEDLLEQVRAAGAHGTLAGVLNSPLVAGITKKLGTALDVIALERVDRHLNRGIPMDGEL